MDINYQGVNMKFYIDDKLVYELNDTELKIIKHVIHEENLNEVLEDKIVYVISSYVLWCRNRLTSEWNNKLKLNGVKMIPTNEDELAELIFNQEDYRSRNDIEPFNEKLHKAPRKR